jgi:hypothetical protein
MGRQQVVRVDLAVPARYVGKKIAMGHRDPPSAGSHESS